MSSGPQLYDACSFDFPYAQQGGKMQISSGDTVDIILKRLLDKQHLAVIAIRPYNSPPRNNLEQY